MRLFAEPLIRGTASESDAIDAEIMKHVKKLGTASHRRVDRNILPLAIYEMLHREDIPPCQHQRSGGHRQKGFPHRTAGKFVNGILRQDQG